MNTHEAIAHGIQQHLNKKYHPSTAHLNRHAGSLEWNIELISPPKTLTLQITLTPNGLQIQIPINDWKGSDGHNHTTTVWTTITTIPYEDPQLFTKLDKTIQEEIGKCQQSKPHSAKQSSKPNSTPPHQTKQPNKEE